MMKVTPRTDWQLTEVELLKTLQNYSYYEFNYELGAIDYTTDGDEERKSLMRVVVDSHHQSSNASMNIVAQTLEDLDGGGFDEAVLVANDITSASRLLVMKADNLNVIHPRKQNHTNFDLMRAINKKTMRLCKMNCGKTPTSEEDCEGISSGSYVCEVRRISDDADFHVKMGWGDLLISDFKRLIEIQKGMKG
jgi:hypothetical protein